MKKILMYLGNHMEKEPALTRVMQDLNIPFRILTDEDIIHTTGYLMGLEGFDDRAESIPSRYDIDLMILSEISDDEINVINALLKTMNVEMKRKAMLTEHNQHWAVCDLLQEIEKEHRFFQQMEEIRSILMQSKDLVIEHYTSASWQVYEKAFYKAYDVISKDSTPEAMDEAFHELTAAKSGLKKVA